MKRRRIALFAMLVCLAIMPATAFAAEGMPDGTLMPFAPAPEEPPIVVTVGEPLYGAAAWAGFTRGIVQNAPSFMHVTFEVTGPSGEVTKIEGAAADACWTRELWDPETCDRVGIQVPFNSRLGVKAYMMGWFTPTFVAAEPGVYTVHSTLTQTRPAPDLLSWGPDLKRHFVCMPGYFESDYTFAAVE